MATRDLSDASPDQASVVAARTRFRPLCFLLLVAVVGGALLSGCSLPRANAVGCSGAPAQVITELSSRLTAPGHLRNGRVVRQEGDGIYFVSAEFIPAGRNDHYDGDILTWATSSLSGKAFQSVGTKSQHDSSWPSSSIKVTANGAMQSRGCTYAVVGKQPLTQCQRAAAAAGLSQLCSHLPSGQ